LVETAEGFPAEQSVVTGAVARGGFVGVMPPSMAVPHWPVIESGALQDAPAPPYDPGQVQVHGPVPLTVGVPPTEQRLLEGFV